MIISKKLRKLAKLYLYLRLGYANYLSMFISIINFSLVVWNFTDIRKVLGYGAFVVLFISLYLPITYVLGSIDLKKGLSKLRREIDPFWKRPVLIERKIYVGSILQNFGLPLIACLLKLEKCLQESYKDTLKYVVTYGNEIPQNDCVCRALKEEGLIDDELFKTCLELTKEKE